MQNDTSNLKRYLMGTLPEPEMEEIDLRVISDESFSDELTLAETDLIEDYLEGSLTDEEQRLFHANFLTSDSRREQLHEIELLKTYARNQAAQKKQPEPDPAPRVGFVDLLKAYLRPLTLGAAVVALLVVGLFWFGYLGGSGSALEKQYAELNKKDLSNTAELTGYANVNLTPGSFRDANSATRQSGDQLTETVLFRLILTSKVDGTTIKANVLRGSSAVFTVDAAKVYQNAGGQDIRLLLPKSILQKGHYQIRLENASGAEAGTFAFVIE